MGQKFMRYGKKKPSIESKPSHRERLNRAMSKYLKEGGKIKKVKIDIDAILNRNKKNESK